MKNWKKYLSPLLSSVMLLSTAAQTAVPLVAYAEDSQADDTVAEAVEMVETATLITTPDELTHLVDTLATIEHVEIVDEILDENALIYTAVNEAGAVFSILDENGLLNIEVAEIYASVTGRVVETEAGDYLIVPESVDDLTLAVVEEEVLPETDEITDEPIEEVEETIEDEEPAEEVVETEEETDEEVEDEVEVDESEVDEPEAEAFSEFQAFNEEIETLQAPTFDLSLMHMNDTHARVPNYARMMTAVNTFRSANPNSLLFHAGDVFSGTLYFNEYEGEADLALLNLMGIDAFTFGNHEFDLGGSPNGHQSLANFVQNANFPFLGTNINFANDPHMAPFETNGTLVNNPAAGQIYNSIVFNVNGESVGVFGLTTEDTANIASPGSITFSNYIATAEQAVADFEAAGINKIIALTHIGYASTPSVGNDIILANQVDGIDIIVGGHSHTALAEPDLVESGESPTLIVQAGANADNLGTLHVGFNDAGEVVSYEGALLRVADYEPDADALAALAPYQEEVESINNQETGAVAVRDLENPRYSDGFDVSVRANETPLGNLVTDAMLAKTRELYPETVIAFQNGGGIRAPIAEGPITVGEVINVLPFGNNPVVVDLTGYEILELMELSLRADQRPGGGLEENGGFLHVSGMVYYFDSQRPVGNRMIAMFIEAADGTLTPINLNETYRVTTNAFTGQGGDGLTPFARAYADGRVQDTGAIDWEQLRDYMVEERYLDGVVDPQVENRSNNLEGGTLPDDLVDDALELRIARLERAIANLEAALDDLETENAALVEQINALRELLADLEAALEARETDISELEERLRELEERIAELEERVDEEEPGGEDPNGEEPNGEDPNGETPDDKDPDQDKPTPPGDADDDDNGTAKPGKPHEGSKKEKDGKPLPATGSTIDNTTLYFGVIILVAGSVIYVLTKKKRA